MNIHIYKATYIIANLHVGPMFLQELTNDTAYENKNEINFLDCNVYIEFVKSDFQYRDCIPNYINGTIFNNNDINDNIRKKLEKLPTCFPNRRLMNTFQSPFKQQQKQHISEVYFISSWIRKRNIWPIWPRLCKMTLFWRGLRKRWPPCRTLPSTVMYTKYELIENSWTANDILMKLSSMLHPLQVHN